MRMFKKHLQSSQQLLFLTVCISTGKTQLFESIFIIVDVNFYTSLKKHTNRMFVN